MIRYARLILSLGLVCLFMVGCAPGLRREPRPSVEKALEREVREQERREAERKAEELERRPIEAATPEELLPVAPPEAPPAPAEVQPATPEVSVPAPPEAPPLPEVVETPESRVRDLSMKGMLLEQEERWEEALGAYEEALQSASESAFLLSRVARLRLRMGNAERALEAAEAAIRITPDDADLQMIYARALSAVGDATRADLAFERVVELAPKDDAARMSLAQDYFNRGEWASAARWFEELLRRDPDRLPVRHALGLCRLRLGEFDAAIEHFTMVVEKYPNRETYLALAEAREGRGDISGAARIYSLMANNQKDDVESRRRLGRLLVKHGTPQDHRVAADWFQQVLEIVPIDEEALRMLAYLHFTFKEFARSESYLGELLQHHPEGEEGLALGRQIGVAYLRQVKDASAALRIFQQLEAATPEDARNLMGRGLALFELGQRAEAAAAFEAVLTRDPDLLEPHVQLIEMYRRERDYARMLPHLEAAARLIGQATSGEERTRQLLFVHSYCAQAYMKLERFEEARQAARQAVELAPDDEDAVMLLAQTYLEENRLEEMEKIARDYLARFPNSAAMLNFLGYSFADKGIRLEEAEQLIRRALTFSPDSGAIVDSLGWVLYRKGRYQEAIAELERAARLSPDEAEITDHLGDAYYAAGMLEKARRQWERTLELEPSNKEVQDKLANIKDRLPQPQNP